MIHNHYLRVDSRTHDRFYIITECEGFVHDSYVYNVQEFDAMYRVDEQNECTVKSYAYCGIGRFFKTTEEAYDWIDKRDRE